MAAGSSTSLKRSWGQRLLIVGVALSSVGSLAAASGIFFLQRQLEQTAVVGIEDGSEAIASADPGLAPGDGPTTGTTVPGQQPATGTATADFELGASDENPNEPVETFPPAEPAARNILITGADNNSCIDPDSPYAAAFGNRDGFGERSDTIMMWRINPATSQLAVLSFPRDLWVTIDGRSSKNRINAAYKRDEPQRLINTISQNFGILTDHFIQVDFCAFKRLVDAVDGVSVPFENPVRDVNTGLNALIESPGCWEFDGDHALAYVRSRKMQEFTDGEWRSADGLSDLSRISRQQDFIRRVVDEAIANAFSPSVIGALLDTTKDFIVRDDRLTPDKILQFAGVVRNIDPAAINTYQIQARGENISGNAVLVPRLGGDNMQAVLALFRGEATLAEPPSTELDAPESTVAPATTVPLTTVPVTTQLDSAAPITDPLPETTTTVEAVPFETLPQVIAEDDIKGLVPDAEISCA